MSWLALFTTLSLASANDWFTLGSSPGNRLTLLGTGSEVTAARDELLNAARRSIYISGFSFKPDKYGRSFLDALCRQKKKEDLEVRILVDHYGSEDLLKDAARVRACGINLMFYNPPRTWGLNNLLNTLHEKLMIVDGVSVITGGSGYGNWYRTAAREGASWHDLNMRIDGPTACVLQQEFERNWQDSVAFEQPLRFRKKWNAERKDVYGPADFIECEAIPQGRSRVLAIYANPLFREGRPLLDRYLQAIEAAQGEIKLYAPYFVPLDVFMDALIAARVRGVEVSILTNSKESSDEPKASLGMFGVVGKLIRGKVKVFMWPRNSVLHRKGGVYGKRWAVIGSDNLNGAGQNYNSEVMAFTDDPKIVAQLEAEMTADFEGAIPLTEELAEKNFNSFEWWQRKAFQYLRPYF